MLTVFRRIATHPAREGVAGPHGTPSPAPIAPLGIARRLVRDNKGVALVEFALVAPILVTMYLGMVELSMAVGHDRKGTLIVRTLADLVTQQGTVTDTDMNNIFSATTAILAPYPVKEVALRVTSVRTDKAGKVFVDWSNTKEFDRTGEKFNPLARCADGAGLVPVPLRVKGTSLVVAESRIRHTPVVSQFVGTIDMKETFPMRPRNGGSVGRDKVPTSPCPGEMG